MSSTVLSLISGAAGIVLGWGLGVLSTWLTDRKRQEQQRQHVRQLIRLEAKQNIKSLGEFWASVEIAGVHVPGTGLITNVTSSPDEVHFDQGQRLARNLLPEWSYLMWETQAGMLPQALSTTELERVYAVYAALKTFKARWEHLRALFDTEEGKNVSQLYGQLMQRRQLEASYVANQALSAGLKYFDDLSRPYWDDCQRIYSQLRGYLDYDLIAEDMPTLVQQ